MKQNLRQDALSGVNKVAMWQPIYQDVTTLKLYEPNNSLLNYINQIPTDFCCCYFSFFFSPQTLTGKKMTNTTMVTKHISIKGQQKQTKKMTKTGGIFLQCKRKRLPFRKYKGLLTNE